MKGNRQIRALQAEEIQTALDLAWEVFSDFVARDYTDEGIDEYWQALDYEYYLHRFGEGEIRMWGAFEEDTMVGVCAIRDLRQVMLLYVDGDHHRQGIATNLLKKAAVDCKNLDDQVDRLTVDSSPYALPFFVKMGFSALTEEQSDGGMRYIPMALRTR